jgi:hypothetical protein
MEEYMLLIILASLIVGGIVGWRLHEMFIINLITQQPEVMEEACQIARKGLASANEFAIETDDGEVIKTSGTELEIEQVNGVLYAYMKDTGRFVGQADTIENLMSIAHTRFPGKTFFGILPEEDQKS